MLINASIFGFFTFLSVIVFYYKNLSFLVMKKLLMEVKVVTIIILSLSNLIINIVAPKNALSGVMGLIYVIICTGFVSIDALKLKSRKFIIFIAVVFTVIHLYLMYETTFGNWDNGIVLLEYTVGGEKLSIFKRGTKRSIYMQVFLFGINGVYTMLLDTKMELMVNLSGKVKRRGEQELIHRNTFPPTESHGEILTK